MTHTIQSHIDWNVVDSFSLNHSHPELTSSRTCPLCNSAGSTIFYQIADFQFYSDSQIHPKRVNITQTFCTECDCLYMTPCYSEYGFNILFQEAAASYGAPEWKYNGRVKWLAANVTLVKDMTLLDVGCHDGTMLSRLPEAIHKIGIDIDQNVLEEAQKKYPDIQFLCCNLDSDIDTLRFRSSIDVIALFHVLEHVRRPVELLQKLLTLAHDETTLAVEVPILEHGNHQDINGFFSVHHLTHFTIQSITECLTIAGWKPIKSEEVEQSGGYRLLAQPGREKISTSRGTDRYVLYGYLAKYYNSLKEKSKKIAALEIGRYCVLWGAGSHTELLYKLTPLFTLSPERKYIIVDNASYKWGTTWRGIQIYSPDILHQIDWSETILIVSSYGGQESIVKEAVAKGVKRDHMVTLY